MHSALSSTVKKFFKRTVLFWSVIAYGVMLCGIAFSFLVNYVRFDGVVLDPSPAPNALIFNNKTFIADHDMRFWRSDRLSLHLGNLYQTRFADTTSPYAILDPTGRALFLNTFQRGLFNMIEHRPCDAGLWWLMGLTRLEQFGADIRAQRYFAQSYRCAPLDPVLSIQRVTNSLRLLTLFHHTLFEKVRREALAIAAFSPYKQRYFKPLEHDIFFNDRLKKLLEGSVL